MGFRAWLRQVLRKMQEKVDHFLGLGVRPGDQESPSSTELCIRRRRCDSNNSRQPSPHLPEGEKGFYVREGVPLYKATLNGDREKTQQILNRNERTLLRSSLTEGHETALHVAVGARQAAIVKELVGRMESEDLELRDVRGNTALCVAVATGSVKIAKILMEKKAELEFIRGADNKTPLYIAAVSGCPEMVRFLYEIYKQHISHLTDEAEQRDMFLAFIHAGLFDLAIKMLKGLRDLAWERNSDDETALGILARKPSAFAGESSTTPKTLIDKC